MQARMVPDFWIWHGDCSDRLRASPVVTHSSEMKPGGANRLTQAPIGWMAGPFGPTTAQEAIMVSACGVGELPGAGQSG